MPECPDFSKFFGHDCLVLGQISAEKGLATTAGRRRYPWFARGYLRCAALLPFPHGRS
jgi:hypothetical protein